MLVYGNTRGRRVVGPRYDDLDVLSVCLYESKARLTSFQGASTYPQDLDEPLPPLATMHWAAWNGHAELIRSLAKSGSKVNQLRFRMPVYEEFAPLHFAVLRGHVAAVEALICARAELEKLTSMTGMTPLDIAEVSNRG